MPDIDILIKATDQASAPIKKVEGEMKNLGTSAKTTSTGLSGLGNVLKAGLTTALVGTAAAMAGLGVFLTQSLGQARAQIEADKQLEQVIKSTGGAAGVTAKQAQDLATSLMNVTNFGDDAIESGQSLLLTFTGIGKDVFPRATETMLDMSQALGQDLKSSAIQLGKALNDPVQGITALSRVGVSFTEQQKEMIKTMVEAGNTAGAQGVILDELGKEFGGSAKAMADPVKQLQNAWGELEESVGMALVPLLNNLAKTVLPYVQAAAASVSDGIRAFTLAIENGKTPLQALSIAIGNMIPADWRMGWVELHADIMGFLNTLVGNAQNSMGWIKLAWDADWHDMRTTLDTFTTETPGQVQAFWDEVKKLFTVNGAQLNSDWAFLWGYSIFSALTGFVTLVIANGTEMFTALNGIISVGGALIHGNWQGVWNGLYDVANAVTNAMLNMIEFVFGPELRDKLVGALTGAWDGMKAVWQNISSWWNSTIGALLGQTSGLGSGLNFGSDLGMPSPLTATPNFAVVNPQNTATIQSVGGISVTQHFYGQTDPPAVQNASQDGVLNAARRLGLK